MNNPDAPTPSTQAAEALDQLKALPSFEDTQAQVRTAMDEIVMAANKIVPGVRWKTPQPGTSGNCQRPYEQTDGKRYFLPNKIGEHATITESDWAQILQAARTIAAKIDANDSNVFQDKPGNHDVEFVGPGGLYLRVGYEVNLVVGGYTGCRLPRDQR